MPIQQIPYQNFFGGINCVKAASQLSPGEFHDAQNMTLDPLGGFSKRNGIKVAAAPSGTNGNLVGAYSARFAASGGTVIPIVLTDAKIYTFNQDWSSPTDRSGALVIGTDKTKQWSFDILNDIVVMGNGTDTPIQLSSAPAASALTSGLPFTTFKFPVQYRGYMFYFVPTVGGSVLYDRVYFSSLDDPTTVDANDFIDVGKKQGGDIRGAIVYNGSLYVFKRNAIYQIIFQPQVIDSAGDLFPFSTNPNPTVSGIGTQSHRSIIRFSVPSTHPTPGQEYVFFVDQFGVPRVFDGVVTIGFDSKIGYSVDQNLTTLATLDSSLTYLSHSVNYPVKNRLYFLLGDGTAGDTVWFLDYKSGFSIMRNRYDDSNANPRPFVCSVLSEKSEGLFKPYFLSGISSVGTQVWEDDIGTTDDDNSSPVAINDYVITGTVAPGGIAAETIFHEFHVRGQTQGYTVAMVNTAGKMKISYYADATTTAFVVDASVSLDSGYGAFSSAPLLSVVYGVSEIHGRCKSLYMKIESSVKMYDVLYIEQFAVLADVKGPTQVALVQ